MTCTMSTTSANWPTAVGPRWRVGQGSLPPWLCRFSSTVGSWYARLLGREAAAILGGPARALRSVAQLISTALERAEQRAQIEETKRDLEPQGQSAHEGGAGRRAGRSVGRGGGQRGGRHGAARRGPGKMTADLKHVIGEVIESASQFAEDRGWWPRSRQLPERILAEPGRHGRADVGLDRTPEQGDPRDQPERQLRS